MDLKKFRYDYHLGQNELADVLGCTQANVSRIESGSRSITGLQIRLLIEKYGLDVISKYATPSELPATAPAVSIDLSRSSTQISGNQAPVNSGSGTQTNTDADLVQALKSQASVLSSQSQQISDLIQQQARLIALLEAAQK